MGDKIYVAKQDTLEAVQQTVNETKTTIGNIDDPAGEDTMVGLIKSIPETVPAGVVKSVQSGVLKGISTSDTLGADNVIKINNVNPAKCLVIIQTMQEAYTDKTFGMGGFFKSLTSTELTVRVFDSMLFSWQVIEFF